MKYKYGLNHYQVVQGSLYGRAFVHAAVNIGVHKRWKIAYTSWAIAIFWNIYCSLQLYYHVQIDIFMSRLVFIHPMMRFGEIQPAQRSLCHLREITGSYSVTRVGCCGCVACYHVLVFQVTDGCDGWEGKSERLKGYKRWMKRGMRLIHWWEHTGVVAGADLLG